MADKGIIFSEPLVRALLDGRKTQTRRLLSRDWSVLGSSWRGHNSPWGGLDFTRAIARSKNTLAIALVGSEDAWHDPHLDVPFLHPEDAARGARWEDNQCWYRVRPPYAPGDRLWVKEGWAKVGDAEDDIHACPDLRIWAYYRADSVCPEHQPWRSPRFMPREFSRITLSVTDVRVQRLAELSPEDARAEGVDTAEAIMAAVKGLEPPLPMIPLIGAYAHLWNTLHDKPGERWEDDPWVVAVSFDVHRCNIDALAAQGEARAA